MGRSDEIGCLGENLNILSVRLLDALDELKEKNEKLLADVEVRRKFERQQMDFFSAVSHELKTPVTILKGQISGMIAGVGGYRDHNKYLRRCYQTTCSMETLIEEILDVSRMKSAGFSLKTEAFDMGDFTKKSVSSWKDIATDKGLILEENVQKTVQIRADKTLFRKVINNLIGNAVNYTRDSGTIRILVYTEKDVPFLVVENDTEPIPSGEISQLFEAFYRREKSRSRQTGGSGLGLYIVKTILDYHGFAYRFQNISGGVQMKIRCLSDNAPKILLSMDEKT